MKRAGELPSWRRPLLKLEWLIALGALVLAAEPSAAATLYGTPENYRSMLSLLRPGDTLRLSSGLYTRGLPLHGLSGIPGKPILIVGESSGAGTVFMARPGSNTISIKNSAHLAVRSLRLDGAGYPVDAVKAEGTSAYAYHITLEDLTIVNHGVDQQTVGISTKCPAWGWVIRGNVIRGAGTGMYFGNSDGSAPFVGGLIENNLIVDTVGYNLQIKHQTARPAAMPIEPMQTVIRSNAFSKANGGSSGTLARPNMLLGHFPLSGAGADDSYSVYGNFFHENPNESLLQVEGNVVVHSNVFLNSRGDALRIQAHRSVPKQVTIGYNTVIARDVGVRVAGGDSRFRQEVIGNAVFAGHPISGGEQQANIVGSYESAVDFLILPFAAPGAIDMSPVGEKLALPLTDEQATRNPGDRDFYGRCRDIPVAGAILPDRPAPWPIDLSRRPGNHSWDEPCRGL